MLLCGVPVASPALVSPSVACSWLLPCDTPGSGDVGRGLQLEDAVAVFARSCGSVCNKPPTHTSVFRVTAGARNLVFDLRITHDRYGKSAQLHHNGQLTHPNDLDAPLRLAAKSKIDDYREQYANNQNISFLPAITSTSTRMHGEFLRLLFLQAHRETTAHFTALGMPAQQHCDSFRYRRAAFYNGLKSKVGLAAAKAAALRVNLNINGCSIVAPPARSSRSSRACLTDSVLSHNLPMPHVH